MLTLHSLKVTFQSLVVILYAVPGLLDTCFSHPGLQ